MDDVLAVLITTLLCLPAGFALGVIFHRQVISEAESMKTHVSDEVANVGAEVASLRGDLKAFVEKIGAKL